MIFTKENMDPSVDPSISAPPPRSRRSKVIGSAIAVLAMAGLGGLAWHLTHPADAPAGAPGQRAGGPGGGPGGARGGRGAPATTVGVATAARADIPVVLDALGTVTAAA